MVLFSLVINIAPCSSNHTLVHIGKFAGREEAICKKRLGNSQVFVFVLEGAFEVQYRLLEARDGLALENIH